MAARRDISGVFDAELKSTRHRKTAVLDNGFHLSHKGITFQSETQLPEWTEVGVEMRMPVKGVRKDQQISCRGVVVQCVRRAQGKGFDVALVFVDLPKKTQSQLEILPASQQTVSVSIAR